MLDRRLAAWTARWEASIEAAGSPRDRVMALFDALVVPPVVGTDPVVLLLATASERPRGDGSDNPVLRLVEADAAALVVRLRELVDEAAGLPDPGAWSPGSSWSTTARSRACCAVRRPIR